MTSVGAGSFGLGVPRPESIKLKKGESVIISYWVWKKFGYSRKMISLDEDGNVSITVL